MVLSRKFTQAVDNDYERLVAAAGRLRAILDSFAEGSLPPEYDSSRLAAYATSLVDTRRTDGSFSSSPDPEGLDPETSADAHRFVTWVAVAFLNLLRGKYPEEASGVEDLDNVILDALNSPVAGNLLFPESGPAEVVQQIEAVLILSSGGIPGRLKKEPLLAPVLAAALDELAAGFRQRISDRNTSLPGGIDYTLLFEQAVTVLS